MMCTGCQSGAIGTKCYRTTLSVQWQQRGEHEHARRAVAAGNRGSAWQQRGAVDPQDWRGVWQLAFVGALFSPASWYVSSIAFQKKKKKNREKRKNNFQKKIPMFLDDDLDVKKLSEFYSIVNALERPKHVLKRWFF